MCPFRWFAQGVAREWLHRLEIGLVIVPFPHPRVGQAIPNRVYADDNLLYPVRPPLVLQDWYLLGSLRNVNDSTTEAEEMEEVA